jgi:hypothetical protein
MTTTYSLDKFIDRLLDEVEYEHGQSGGLQLTALEIVRLCVQAAHVMERLSCRFCGVDTSELHEYYMVTDAIWERYGPADDGCACIGCLEARMGRQLQPDDFPKDIPVNTDDDWDRSERLRNRLGLDQPALLEVTAL